MKLRYKLITIAIFTSIIFWWLFYLESQKVLKTPISAWEVDHSADCAVVLTGGPFRVREGFDLLVQGRVKKLILSGVHPQAHLREIFPQWPYYGSLSEKDVVLERRSVTTYGNAQQVVPLLEALYCRDFVLVTSRLHMYRAMRTFGALNQDRWKIYPRSIVGKNYHLTWYEIYVEVIKSMFYSLFAY